MIQLINWYLMRMLFGTFRRLYSWSTVLAQRILKQSLGMPSSADNCSPFEKQLLTYYCTSIKAKCLITGHQVTMQPELSIMNFKIIWIIIWYDLISDMIWYDIWYMILLYDMILSEWLSELSDPLSHKVGFVALHIQMEGVYTWLSPNRKWR